MHKKLIREGIFERGLDRRQFVSSAIVSTAAAAAAVSFPSSALSAEGRKISLPPPPRRSRIADFRARPNTLEYMRHYEDAGWGRFYKNPGIQKLPDFVASLDALGINRAVFAGRGDLQPSNVYIAECHKAFPDRIVPVAGVDVNGGPESVHKLNKLFGDEGFRGVCFDLDDGLTADSRQLYPIYYCCIDHGVPVILVMGPLANPKSTDPSAIAVVANDLPELKIVCSHAVPHTDSLISISYRYDNVYLEPSIYNELPGFDDILHAAVNIIPDKVIYGSGFPFDRLDYFKFFDQEFISDEVLDKILYRNAMSVLGFPDA